MMRSNQPKVLFLRLFSLVGILGLFLLLPSLRGNSEAAPPSLRPAADGKYIGAGKCKNCHDAEASGQQYSKWKDAQHSKAFETLKGEKAKKIAAERGIDDPSKSDKCLKCHVTAFGVDKKLRKRSFKPEEEGVGCEACHGPGDDHNKARFRAAAEADDSADAPAFTQIGEDEIVSAVTAETCVKCHNEESPTYKPFCFFHKSQKIRHLHLLKPRTEAEKAALKGCDCGDEIKCDHKCTDECRGVKK